MNIIVEIKNVYGSTQIYPVSQEAKIFARIAGTKTLTGTTISLVKQLGYEVEIQSPELSL